MTVAVGLVFPALEMRPEVVNNSVAGVGKPVQHVEKITPQEAAVFLLRRKDLPRDVPGLHVHRNRLPVRIMLHRRFDVALDLV